MATSNTTPRVIQLTEAISDSVVKLKAILGENDLPSSFSEETQLPALSQEASDLRDAIIDATSDLQDLLLDPLNLLTKYAAHNNMVSLQIIARSKIANIVPAGGQVAFEEIAQQTGLSVIMTKRLLRHAMTMHIFQEPVPGMVAHTTASKALQVNHLNAWLDCGTHEMWPAAVRGITKSIRLTLEQKMVDAALQWPDSQEPHETAYALANGTNQSIYDIVGTNPHRAMRFAGAMEAFAVSPAYDTQYIVDHYDWAGLGDAHVVDLGGAQGHVAFDIARRFPGLRFTVQDMGQVIAGAESKVPEELKGRISFMGHDLFTPQPVQADVYYIRWVLHNWPDKPAVAILRAQVPMLKNGTRIIINETCMPESGTIPLWRERNLRAADINMGAVFNAKERTVEEWRSLLAEADPRFSLEKAVQPKGSALSILDVVWKDTH